MSDLCPKCGEHCYAKMLNATGSKVYDEERFCETCGAHLAPSGICLNACHLSDSQRSRFQDSLKDVKP